MEFDVVARQSFTTYWKVGKLYEYTTDFIGITSDTNRGFVSYYRDDYQIYPPCNILAIDHVADWIDYPTEEGVWPYTIVVKDLDTGKTASKVVKVFYKPPPEEDDDDDDDNDKQSEITFKSLSCRSSTWAYGHSLSQIMFQASVTAKFSTTADGLVCTGVDTRGIATQSALESNLGISLLKHYGAVSDYTVEFRVRHVLANYFQLSNFEGVTCIIHLRNSNGKGLHKRVTVK